MDPKTQAVQAFQVKIGAPQNLDLKKTLVDGPSPEGEFIHDTDIKQIQLLAWATSNMALIDEKLKMSYKLRVKDERVMRVHLILSELQELVEAFLLRDEVRALDAIADLMYVVLGTATTFDLPEHEAFWEVHGANMTKDIMNDHTADIKGKGESYQPPRLKEILEAYRSRR
jgi:hypothetical protein